MNWLEQLLGSQTASASPDPSAKKKEQSDLELDDSGYVRNVLMEGVPGMEDPSPKFTGIDNTAWYPGPIAVKPNNMPASPINPDIQSLMPAADFQPVETPVQSKQQEAVKATKKQQAKQKEAVAEQPATPAAKEEKAAEPSLLDKLLAAYNQPQDEDTELKTEQDKRKNQMLMLGLIDAATQIGSGVNKSGFNPNNLQRFYDQAGQGVADLQERRKSTKEQRESQRSEIKFGQDVEKYAQDKEKAQMQMNDEKAVRDPNSEISKMSKASIVEMLNRIGRKDQAKKIAESPLSHKQLEDVYGQMNMQNYISMYEAQQNRLALEKERNAAKADQKKEKSDKESKDKLDKYIQTTREKIVKEADAVQKGRQEITMLESALKNPSAVRDTAALYSMIKSFDPESVVREGEVALAMQGTGYWDSANVLFSRLKKGDTRVLTDQYLKQIYDYAREVQKIRDSAYRNNMDTRLNFAKERLGLQPGEEEFIDPLFKATAQRSSSNEVERKLPDGRIAIFDGNTKQFIRYK